MDALAGFLNIGLLNALARGAKVKFVADKEYIAPTECTFQAFVVRRALIKSGELNSPAQLKGRRIAATRASPSEYFVEKLLNTAGLTLDDVIIVDILASTQPEAFEKGTIDAAITAEPLLTRILESKHAVLWRSSQQIIPNFQLGLIVYGPTLLDKNPEIGRRFMVAYLKAVQQYNQGKTGQNLEILAKHTGLDQEFLKKACWPSFHGDGKINIESVLDFQTWAVKKGFLDKVVQPNQFWDPSFVDYANKVLSAPMKWVK